MDIKELLIATSLSIQQSSATLWDYTSANSIHHYKNGGRAIPKGLSMLAKDYVMTADADKPVLNAWLLNGHEPVKDSKFVLPRPANCLAVCPNSVYLAAGIESKLYVWHISSGKLVTVQQKHFQPISVIKFSNDGIYICVGGEDGSLITYNFPQLMSFQNQFPQLASSNAAPLYSRLDHNQAITDLVIGNLGAKSRVSTVSSDQTLNIYSLAYGELLKSIAFPNGLTSVVFDLNCYGLFAGTTSGHICQIKLHAPPKVVHETNKLMFAAHKEKITCLALNCDGTILASGSADCMVHIWQTENQTKLKTLEHRGIVTNILFTLNHSNFYAQSYETKVVTGKLEKDFDPGDQMFDVVIKQDRALEVPDFRLWEEKLMKDNDDVRVTNMLLNHLNIPSSSKKLKRDTV